MAAVLAVLFLLNASAPDAAVDLRAWEGLSSPYFAVRREHERRLVHLQPGEGRRVADALLGSEDPLQRRAAAAWICAALDRGDELSGSEIGDALLAESDPAVRQRLIHAAARHPQALERVRAAVRAGQGPAWILDQVLDERVLLLLEGTMHDGRIPGFFDGQFSELHALDPSAYQRLVRNAWNPRVHLVVRALSVMALQEARHPELILHLRDLLMAASDEIDVPDELINLMRMQRIGLRVNRGRFHAAIRRALSAKLSQYARFSLAKAGVAGPIQDKIAQLEARVQEKLRYLGDRPRTTLGGLPAPALEEAMDLVFEIGYHHQQLDDFEAAEAAYRRVLERPEHIDSKGVAHYNLACIRALQGRKDEALDHLFHAFASGLGDPAWARRDGDLACLRGDPRFEKLLADAQAGRLGS